MRKNSVLLRTACILTIVCSLSFLAFGQELPAASEKIELASYEGQFSNAYLAPAKLDGQPGLAVVFEGSESLHYYASPETALSPDLVLSVKASSESLEFSPAVFPSSKLIKDSEGANIDVYAGDFTVFLPITTGFDQAQPIEVTVQITGQTCTDEICLMPFEEQISASIDLTDIENWPEVTIEKSDKASSTQSTAKTTYSVGIAFGLAFLAGLILNIMPCVLPVIPLKVLSIFDQAKESKSRCIAMGLSFCLGILIFFAILAGLNIVLRLGYDTAFQWGDHFRYPAFVIGMAMLMIFLAMFMFDVFSIIIPSAIGAKEGKAKGYSGSIGMGFLAALMGTPCSFAILTAAFAWAQTQNIVLSTTAIMLIGVGMAAPYALLTSMPGLLKHLPKAGRWSELFKQSMGFVLLGVGVWLILALPETRRPGAMYFAVILSFAVWIWGTWVTFNTSARKKWAIRILALVIVTLAGLWLLPAPQEDLVDWQQYDPAAIEQALQNDRPILMDFTADWCLNCKVVEKLVYGKKKIAELIEQKNVFPIKADTTLETYPAAKKLKTEYSGLAVPLQVLLIPGKDEPIFLPGIAITDELKKHLESLPDKKNDNAPENQN